MHIVFTALQLVILSFGVYLVWRAGDHERSALDTLHDIEATALKLRAERDRVTVAERELDALRRELRKLSGKFYAAQREAEVAAALGVDLGDEFGQLDICENWAVAKVEGPTSAAAQCQCNYCLAQRAQRDAQRRALVPPTVRGQAEAAKLNAGKP